MIKNVVFDLDDTLYPEKEFVLGGFRAVAHCLADRYDLELQRVYHRLVQMLKSEGRGRIFNTLLEEMGLSGTSVEELVRIYRTHRPQLQLFPDAEALLVDLRSQYTLGLITDGAAQVQWNKIRALNMESVLELILVTDDYGRESWKPSPFPYEYIQKKTGSQPESCLYIGDNPEKDFITARKLGWHTIRIVRPDTMFFGITRSREYEADYTVSLLAEVPQIIERLVGERNGNAEHWD